MAPDLYVRFWDALSLSYKQQQSSDDHQYRVREVHVVLHLTENVQTAIPKRPTKKSTRIQPKVIVPTFHKSSKLQFQAWSPLKENLSYNAFPVPIWVLEDISNVKSILKFQEVVVSVFVSVLFEYASPSPWNIDSENSFKFKSASGFEHHLFQFSFEANSRTKTNNPHIASASSLQDRKASIQLSDSIRKMDTLCYFCVSRYYQFQEEKCPNQQQCS